MRLSPSTLNDFLACRYLTWLEQEREAGRIELVEIPRPDADLVRERGLRHEEAFREGLIRDGRQLVDIDGADLAEKVGRTHQAMLDGAEVIYQAAFADPDGWVGFADFLLRGDEPSDLGAHSYEAYDTKLAKHPKPYFILQLAFYTEQIGRLQGRMPREMHVIPGDSETKSFAFADFAAYVGRVRRDFLRTVRDGFTPPYPYPVEHCAWCPWWRHCADKRRADDHVSRVAGLGRSQGLKLEAAGVHTMRNIAALSDAAQVPRLAQPTLDGLRLQAELQVHTEDTGEHGVSCRSRRAGASTGCRHPPRATCSSTSRATRTGATRASSTCSAPGPQRATTCRSGRTTSARSARRSSAGWTG
jgi:predicted RecB family nuclease